MAPIQQRVTRSTAPKSEILDPKELRSKIFKLPSKPKTWRKPAAKIATPPPEGVPLKTPIPRHDTPVGEPSAQEKPNTLRTAKGRFKAAPRARPASYKAGPTPLNARPTSSKATKSKAETTLTLIAIPLAHRAEATALVQDWRAEYQHPRYPSNRNYAHNGYKRVMQPIEEGPQAGEEEEIKIRIGQQGTHTFTGLGIDYVLCYQRRMFDVESNKEDSEDAGKVEGMMVFFALTKPHNKQNEKTKKAPSYALRNVPRIIVAPFHAGDEFFATLMSKSMASEVPVKAGAEKSLEKVCQEWTNVAFLDPNVDENGVLRMDTQLAVADGVEKIVMERNEDWVERCRAYNAGLKKKC